VGKSGGPGSIQCCFEIGLEIRAIQVGVGIDEKKVVIGHVCVRPRWGYVQLAFG
jgi:hypothetical protein